MTDAEKIGPQITATVRDFVSRSLQSHDARIADLERRIIEIETTQKSMCYRAVWLSDQQYMKHNLCTHDGSLWVAIADAPGKPGAYG